VKWTDKSRRNSIDKHNRVGGGGVRAASGRFHVTNTSVQKKKKKKKIARTTRREGAEACREVPREI
jgi:hypothetical protein